MAVPIKIVPPSKKRTTDGEYISQSVNSDVIDVGGIERPKHPSVQIAEEQPSLPRQSDPVLPSIDHNQSRNDNSNLRALLVGATPLLAGFLGGNMGDAYDIAGKELIKEDLRKQKEDASLLALLKKQNAKSGGSDVTVNVQDPKTSKWHVIPRSLAVRGNVTSEEMARYPEAPKWESASSVGKKAAARAKGTIGVRKAEGLEDITVQGPEGQPMRVTKGTDTARPIDTGAGAIKSQAHMERVESSINQFQSQTKETRDQLSAAKELRKLVNMKTPEADSFLEFKLPKLAGAGQLSNEERTAITGGVSIADWIKLNSSKKTKGIFPPEMRTRLVKLIELLDQKARERYSRTRKQHISTQSKVLNIPESVYAGYLPNDLNEDNIPDKQQMNSGLTPEQRRKRILQLQKETGKR